MERGYWRKKQPEAVRRSLLDHATRLAFEHGLGAVTVQAVSDAAGVTKGGFAHHFPTKQALVNAVFQELLDALDHELDERIGSDPEPHGAFTRAYLGTVLDIDLARDSSPSVALAISMLADPVFRALWKQWFEARIRRHRATDDSVQLAIVRLAADGLWLSTLSGIPVANEAELRARLVQQTQVT
ncbi:TetR/AcrR family transcriptional regulator [Stenotrophomonas acidaminiphila]|uniref:TetR/AcrR family transcriptional regulator n=1 Tax=Stenotrophomonas acidaminiphila TaxID=128780 RepID=UPI0039BC60F6